MSPSTKSDTAPWPPSPPFLTVDVFNYANKNEVNGKNQIGNLGGVVPKPNENPAQLLVGPKFLPRLLWGPYWIVAAGPGVLASQTRPSRLDTLGGVK